MAKLEKLKEHTRISLNNVIKIFYTPGTVFKYTKKESNWIIPLLIIIFISILATYLITPNLTIPEQINKLTNKPGISPDQKDATLNYLNSSYHYITTFIYAVAVKFLYYPVLAFLITLLPLVFGKKAIKYKYVFSAVCYTGVVNSIGYLIDSIIKLNMGTLDKGFNLALFINIDGPVSYLLNVINVFGLWQIVLLSILIATYYGYSKLKSYNIIIAAWGILKLMSAYIAYLKTVI